MLSLVSGIEYANEKVTWGLLSGGVLILLANVVALYPDRGSVAESAEPKNSGG
jgi:hypothetical protein